MKKQTKHAKKHILLRLAVSFLVLFCLTAGVLYVYFTDTLKNFVISGIYDRTSLDVRFDDFKLKIITGEIEVENISLIDADFGKDPFFTAESIKAGLNLRALISGHLWINYMNVEKPVLKVERTREKKINIVEIKKRLGSSGRAGSGGKLNFQGLQIGTLKVNEGAVRFRDDLPEKQFIMELKNINIVLEKFYLPLPAEDKYAELTLDAVIGDSGKSKVSIRGEFNPAAFIKNFEIDMHLDNIVLNQFSPYYNPASPIIIDSGEVSVFCRGACRDGELVGGGYIELSEVSVRAKEGFISQQLFGVAVEKVVTYISEHKDMKFHYTLTGDVSDPQFKLAPGSEKAIINSILNALDIPLKAANNIKEGINAAGENISNGVKKIKDKISDTVNGVVDCINPGPE